MKRILSAVLVMLLITAALASCGGDADTPAAVPAGETKAPDGEQSEAAETTAAETYAYNTYDGYVFRIFAPVCGIGCNEVVDFTEQTGEVLSDAIYLRNRTIEDKMNVDIEAITADGVSSWGTSQVAVCNTFMSAVLADDDEWDCAYLPVGFSPAMAQQGVFAPLSDMPELALREAWWDSVLNDSLTINGQLLMASSPLHLHTLDSTWLLLFNKDMMNDLGLEMPYETVREGKWTLDKWDEYVSAAVSLNGDDSFKFTENGNCVYGVGAHSRSPYYLLNASACMATAGDKGGLKLTLGGDRFFAATDKIAAIFREADGKVHVQNGNVGMPGGYEDLFFNSRALFLTCEVKSTLNLRAMEAEYGMLPFPKFDESQDAYHSAVTHNVDLLVIPVTNPDLSRAAAILDAMSYESWKTVIPAYFDNTICQKGLRDEESIEMLSVVREGRTIEVSLVFGITADFVNDYNGYITESKSGASSLVAKYEEKICAKLDELTANMSAS